MAGIPQHISADVKRPKRRLSRPRNDLDSSLVATMNLTRILTNYINILMKIDEFYFPTRTHGSDYCLPAIIERPRAPFRYYNTYIYETKRHVRLPCYVSLACI